MRLAYTATEEQHRKQAEHNQLFLDQIDQAKYPDWKATVAFYKAVHLVQMLFVRKGHNAGSHHRRNGILKRQYHAVWKAYRPLYAYSRLVRYRCYNATPADLVYILKHLVRAETAIQKSP